jgi:site-specific recombinase XerD
MKPRENATPCPEMTFLTQDEVHRLFAVITGTRDRALFQLAYHHGLRASEVSLLQRDDIHEKQGRIYIPRVKGFIAKTYLLQLEDLRLVRAYLRTCEDDSPYLFISTRGIPLGRRSYWDLMQKYGKGADIPKSKRRLHALRHAIAVHLLDAGADVAFVQDRLGHANIQNTMENATSLQAHHLFVCEAVGIDPAWYQGGQRGKIPCRVPHPLERGVNDIKERIDHRPHLQRTVAPPAWVVGANL